MTSSRRRPAGSMPINSQRRGSSLSSRDGSAGHGWLHGALHRHRGGHDGSASAQPDAGHATSTQALTAALIASDRFWMPSASARAVKAARVAASSRTGTTTPGPSPTGGRPRRALGRLARSYPASASSAQAWICSSVTDSPRNRCSLTSIVYTKLLTRFRTSSRPGRRECSTRSSSPFPR